MVSTGLSTYGQDAAGPGACDELKNLNNFFAVDSSRNGLQTEIPQLKSKKKELEDITIPQAEATQADLDDTIKKIDELSSMKDLTAEAESQLKSLQSIKKQQETVLRNKTPDILRAQLKTTIDDISWKEAQLKCLNEKIQGYSATPEQTFKATTSIVFSILIGLVIMGFFTMAWIDQNVRRAIFSGQTGLQFVTLFSIVIAIILFGITGILQDKELAALLGGLSGYILGRYSAPPRNSNNKDSNSNGSGSSDGVDKAIDRIEVTPNVAKLTEAEPTIDCDAVAFDTQNAAVSELSNDEFKWRSENTAVAVVDNNGVISRVASGKCKITASIGQVVSNACEVTCE